MPRVPVENRLNGCFGFALHFSIWDQTRGIYLEYNGPERGGGVEETAEENNKNESVEGVKNREREKEKHYKIPSLRPSPPRLFLIVKKMNYTYP